MMNALASDASALFEPLPEFEPEPELEPEPEPEPEPELPAPEPAALRATSSYAGTMRLPAVSVSVPRSAESL